jgi:Squalene-hopene cyclase C-terminal domain
MDAASESVLIENFCLPFLLRAQNSDGGWGFHSGSASRAESTCWALLGLLHYSSHGSTTAIQRGLAFLRASQLSDGSWPSTPEEKTGCWVTSLATLTLLAVAPQSPETSAGLQWICKDWPADSAPWRRFLTRFSSQSRIAPINNSYRGWGWTPATSSWVEPTSFALLALSRVPENALPPQASERVRLGEPLLYDRMCPGGGWNCGNPNVYGVAGEPLVGPTVWALLALRHQSRREGNRSSLAWLEGNANQVNGATSIALARICLKVYDRSYLAGTLRLRPLLEAGDYPLGVQAVALSCIALNDQQPSFLDPRQPELHHA